MKVFPAFMRSEANRSAKTAQATPGVEGYVFDGDTPFKDRVPYLIWNLPANPALWLPHAMHIK